MTKKTIADNDGFTTEDVEPLGVVVASEYQVRHPALVGDEPTNPPWLRKEFTITVTNRGGGLWAIKNTYDEVLAHDGTWEWEPMPSNRSPAFIARTRYLEQDAIEHARRAVMTLKINSLTYEDWTKETTK